MVEHLFTQVTRRVEDDILSGHYGEGELIASSRAISMQLSIGQATVQKALRMLEAEGILCKRRGLGMAVAQNALSMLRGHRRKQFAEVMIPALICEADKIGISRKQLWELIVK